MQEVVFARLTSRHLAMLLVSVPGLSAETEFSLSGNPCQRWRARRFRGVMDAQQQRLEGTVVLLQWQQRQPALLQEASASPNLRIDSNTEPFEGPLLNDSATCLQQVGAPWARMLVTMLLLEGGRDMGLAQEAEVTRVVHAWFEQHPPAPYPVDAAVRIGDGVEYLETSDHSLSHDPACVAVGAEQFAQAVYRRAELHGQRHFALLGRPPSLPLLVLVAPLQAAFMRLQLPAAAPQGFVGLQQRLQAEDAAVAMRVRETFGEVIHTMPGSAADKAPLGQQLLALQLRQDLLPQSFEHPRLGIVCSFDCCVPIADAGLFLAGTLTDRHGLIQGLALKTPLGEQLPIDTYVRRYRVPATKAQAAREVFVAYVPLQRGAQWIRQVRLQVGLPGGAWADWVSPVYTGNAREARRVVLDQIPPTQITPDLLEHVLHPALAALQQTINQRKSVAAQQHFGQLDGKPAVSLIIPLYREYGFIRHQVHAFATDPDFSATEIIYVLDRPEDQTDVQQLLNDLHWLYGLPLRLITLDANYGFAGATNIGALLAKGRLLVLLNSDVIPAAPGWLQSWQAWHEEQAGDGVSGVRLLFADGSLQHAGMYFVADLLPWWTNHHYAKGLPGDLERAQVSREVPAVTAAALMIERKRFTKLGGLSEDYVIGDFEDSDLCLKVRAAGGRVHYFGAIALYHLERLSIRRNSDYWGKPVDRYNGWLHTQRWGAAIEALMRDEPEATVTAEQQTETQASAATLANPTRQTQAAA